MKRIVFAVTNDLNNDRRMHRICGSLQNAGYHVVLVGRKLKTSKQIAPKSFGQLRLNCLFNKGKLFYLEYNNVTIPYGLTIHDSVHVRFANELIEPIFNGSQYYRHGTAIHNRNNITSLYMLRSEP